MPSRCLAPMTLTCYSLLSVDIPTVALALDLRTLYLGLLYKIYRFVPRLILHCSSTCIKPCLYFLSLLYFFSFIHDLSIY